MVPRCGRAGMRKTHGISGRCPGDVKAQRQCARHARGAHCVSPYSAASSTCTVEPCAYAVPAEQRQHIVESWTRAATGHRHTRRVYEHCGLDAACLGNGPQQYFQALLIEALGLRTSRRERAQVRAHSRDGKVLLHRGLVESDGLIEERTAIVDELAELLRPRLKERHHAQEPLALVAVEGRPPQTGVGEERLHACGEIAGGQPADVLLIEPVELFLTEDGVAAADALERERGDELVAREELLVSSRRPAEEREEVDHRFGKIAEAVVFHHRGGPVTLAQPFLVRAEDERHVRKARRRLAECLVEQNLLGGIRDVVVATDNIRNRPCRCRLRQP